MNYELILSIATAVGTVGSAAAAVYYGSIRPYNQIAKLEISTFRKVDIHSLQAVELIDVEGDLLEVGFFVRQTSGAPSKNVSILVKKIWYWGIESGALEEWAHFVPSTLRWAAKESVSFSTGAERYCYLGVYGDLPDSDFVGPVFTLSTTENTGDPLWGSHSNLLPSHKGQLRIELLISGENVKSEEFLIDLKLHDLAKIGPLDDEGLPTGGSIKDSVVVGLYQK